MNILAKLFINKKIKLNERGEIVKKEGEKNNKGMIALIICIILTVAIVVGCVFFPDEIFGIFLK